MSDAVSASSKAQGEAIIAKLTAAQYPTVYPYVFQVLIAYIVIYFIVLLISILIIVIPIYRGPVARRKHLWLWRRQVAPGYQYKTAYFVPNGGVAFVISQIFGSILFEIYMLLAYHALRSPKFARNAYQYFWLAIGNAPGFFGFWYAGFGALYTCIFSPSRSISQGYGMQRYLARPLIMNTLCIGTPIVPTVISLGWGVVSIVTAKEKTEAYDAVLVQIVSGVDPRPSLARYTVAGHEFLAQFRWACLFWSIAAVLSVVFYSVTLVLFLRLLKKTVDLTSGKTNLLDNATPSITLQDWPRVIIGQSPLTENTSFFARKLRKSYYLLMWQCGLLMVVSLWYTVDGVVLMIMIDNVVYSESWRTVTTWIVMSSAFLLALALFLQSWRMIDEKDTPPPQTQSHPDPKLGLIESESSNGHSLFVSPA